MYLEAWSKFVEGILALEGVGITAGIRTRHYSQICTAKALSFLLNRRNGSLNGPSYVINNSGVKYKLVLDLKALSKAPESGLSTGCSFLITAEDSPIAESTAK